MLIHGAGLNLRQFTDQHAYFSQHFRVISVSLRGHGGSRMPEHKGVQAFSLDKHRDDVAALARHLGIPSMHVVGNSAGGLIGLSLVQSYGDLVGSLVTFGTAGELRYPNWAVTSICGIDRFMLAVSPRRYLRFMSRSVSRNAAVQKEVYSMFLESAQAVPYLRYHLGAYSFLSTIQSMHIPYLIIRGEHDRDINRVLASTIAASEANPAASIAELSKAGHVANLDQPEAFNVMLKEFLQAVRKG